jgi:hypothetical protein
VDKVRYFTPSVYQFKKPLHIKWSGFFGSIINLIQSFSRRFISSRSTKARYFQSNFHPSHYDGLSRLVVSVDTVEDQNGFVDSSLQHYHPDLELLPIVSPYIQLNRLKAIKGVQSFQESET